MAVNGDGLFERDPNNRSKYIYPDQLSFTKEPFATVIPSRSVSFKVHKTEGLANSALSHHRQGAKYKQENGVWVKVWEFSEPTDCEQCGFALTDADRGRSYYGHLAEWLRSRKHKGSAIFAPFICRVCYDKEQAEIDERNEAKRFAAEERRRKEWDAKFKAAAENNRKQV